MEIDVTTINLFSSKIDFLLWIIGAGFTLTFTFMLFIWKRIDKVDESLSLKINKVDESLSSKVDRNQIINNDINMRLARIEGILYSKECCFLHTDEKIKKAE